MAEAARLAIIGGSMAGLLAAAGADAAGVPVVVLERDRLPNEPASRKGVPQDRQAHVLLHRGLLAIEELLPGLREGLLAAGAPRFDSGSFAWLAEYGWLPTSYPAYDVVSATRPLLEHHVRERVRALAGVRIVEECRVSGLARSGPGWQLEIEDGAPLSAGVVVDASGRGSRLTHWLTSFGISPPEPATVDAQLGYACQVFLAPPDLPLTSPIVIAATPETGRGALAIPVENGRWLVVLAGYGPDRPGRSQAEFDEFVGRLRDPCVGDLIARLEPIGEVTTYRQTGNRRQRYADTPDWPDGLVALGDANCAFNPVYGQGMTVAALQALALRDALRAGSYAGPGQARALQRRLAAATDLPWSIAVGEDMRHPSNAGERSRSQRLLGRWSALLSRQAVHGNRAAYETFAGVYHLMAPPSRLFAPGLILSVLASTVRRPPPSPRPAVLAEL